MNKLYGLSIMTLLLLIGTIFICPVNAEVYNIDANSEETEFLIWSGKEDKVTIKLNSASYPIDILIYEEGEGLFDRTLVWDVRSVTNGEWIWTQPTDDSYYVEISNPTPNKVTVDVEIIESGEESFFSMILATMCGSICCIIGLITFAFLVIIGLIVIIILIAKRKT